MSPYRLSIGRVACCAAPKPFLDWLFKMTRQRPLEALEVIQSRLQEPFIAAGFVTEIKTLEVDSGILLVIVAVKP